MGDLWLSHSGSDGNAGTESSPIRSFLKAYAISDTDSNIYLSDDEEWEFDIFFELLTGTTNGTSLSYTGITTVQPGDVIYFTTIYMNTMIPCNDLFGYVVVSVDPFLSIITVDRSFGAVPSTGLVWCGAYSDQSENCSVLPAAGSGSSSDNWRIRKSSASTTQPILKMGTNWSSTNWWTLSTALGERCVIFDDVKFDGNSRHTVTNKQAFYFNHASETFSHFSFVDCTFYQLPGGSTGFSRNNISHGNICFINCTVEDCPLITYSASGAVTLFNNENYGTHSYTLLGTCRTGAGTTGAIILENYTHDLVSSDYIFQFWHPLILGEIIIGNTYINCTATYSSIFQQGMNSTDLGVRNIIAGNIIDLSINNLVADNYYLRSGTNSFADPAGSIGLWEGNVFYGSDDPYDVKWTEGIDALERINDLEEDPLLLSTGQPANLSARLGVKTRIQKLKTSGACYTGYWEDFPRETDNEVAEIARGY